MIAKNIPRILGTSVTALYGVEKGRRAMVVGNGPSRQSMDLRAAQAAGWLILACNWFYREPGQIMPDYIGAVDADPTRDFLNDRVTSKIPTVCRIGPIKKFIRRAEAGTPDHDKTVLDDPVNYQHLYEWDKPGAIFTGPMMVGLALLLDCNPIVMVGFDGETATIGRDGQIQPKAMGKYNVTRGQIAGILKILPERKDRVFRIGGGDFLSGVIPEWRVEHAAPPLTNPLDVA